MTEQPLTLTAPDGHTINGWQYLPDIPAGTLVISHGMAEHGDRYRELARWLMARQILVITFHHRGHGPDCPEQRQGHYADADGWSKVVGDLQQVIEATRTTYPELPVNLLGHSMGSFIAQSCAQQDSHHIDNLILSATNRINRGQLGIFRLVVQLLAALLGHRRHSRLPGRLTFGQFNRAFRPNRTTGDWLSRDPDQVDRYQSDPACGFDCTLGLWRDFIGGMLSIRPDRWRRDLPVHLFSGTEDAVGEMGKGVRKHFQTIRESGVEQVTLRLFAGGRHEMLNETNRLEVWQYLLSLCHTRTATEAMSNHAHDQQQILPFATEANPPAPAQSR